MSLNSKPLRSIWAIFFICCLTINGVFAQVTPPTEDNLKEREAFAGRKFGMFIHWGAYALLADGEWVMHNKRIPVPQYESIAENFNPTKFNAEEWVLLAKRAGMKYITITSKHHDGFCLFNSKYTTYDVVDHTPYKRDLIRELAGACAKHDIKLCLYYSLLDWHHPDYEAGKHKFPFIGSNGPGNHAKYVDYMCNQLTELLTNYGPIGAIWFDGEWENLKADWNFTKIYNTIHKAQPACLIGNNHHRNVRPGEDFQMFEKDLPGANSHGWVTDAAEVAALPLEMCETMNGSWGYKWDDNKFKSSKDLSRLLLKCNGYNANLLLNIGPMANGKIQQEFVDTLTKMGDFINRYQEAIYGTRGYAVRTWGGISSKGNTLYVTVTKAEDNTLMIPVDAKRKPKTATHLNTGKAVKLTKANAEGFYFLTLPESKDAVADIFKLE